MKHYYQSIGKTSLIDEQSGIIRNVSLIRKGDAEGHFDKKGRQEVVDDKTLTQVFEYCKGAESIKVKADHGSGVLSTIGYVDNFSLTSDKVLGDFHLYESEPQRPRIFEIARKNPEHLGMSLEFEGKDEAKDNKSFSRCDRVLAVALVSDPAANSSLFSVPSGADEPEETETKTNNMDEETTKDTPSADERLEKLEKMFEEFTTKFSKKFEEPESDAVATDKKDEPAGSDPEKTYENPDADKDDEETKKIELAAERAAEKIFKKFAASVGVTQLAKPGTATAQVKEKHFEEHVVDIALKEYSGDTVKARAAILTNAAKYPDAFKAYGASRNVKHS